MGIFGATIMIGFALNAFVAPPQIGDRIVNPLLFQIKNVLEIVSFVGYASICFAFVASGAASQNWLSKTALILAVLGGITASLINIANAIAVQNVPTPDWSNLLIFGLILLAPLLLGISALRTKVIPNWQAFYPILIVGIASLAVWILLGDTLGPSIPAMVQAFAWIGFALLAMSVKPRP
jgi:hypothetical protein